MNCMNFTNDMERALRPEMEPFRDHSVLFDINLLRQVFKYLPWTGNLNDVGRFYQKEILFLIN